MRRPRIGIDLDFDHDGRRWIYKLASAYFDTLLEAGAEPVLLPPGDPRAPREILQSIDGLLLTGGDDPHPALFGERGTHLPTRLLALRRERFLMTLAAELLAADRPCLAVCLGAQMLQVAAGGRLYVDLPSQWPGELHEHRGGALHAVRAEPGGWLDRWWRGREQVLASHHHQAVRELAPGFELEARATDGVIEAWRSRTHRFLFATQWHPEVQNHAPGGDLGGKRIVGAFLEAVTGATGAG